MPLPIAVAAAVAKGAQAAKAAGTVIKGAQAVKAASSAVKGAETASTVAKGVKGVNLLSSSSLASQGSSTAGLLSKMSSIADTVNGKVAGAHSAMSEIVSRDDMSITPDFGQAFDSVKPGRVEQPLGIGNTPEQNIKSSFMKGFDQGLGVAEEPEQQAPSTPSM